jgi:alkylhydroperoxidase family enzyme
MPRIEPIDSPEPDIAQILAKTPSRHGHPNNLFATLAHHPKLLERINVLGGLFVKHSLLPIREREIMIIRMAWLIRCEYEYAQHSVIGQTAGLTEEEVRSLAGDEGDWSAREALLIQLTDEIHYEGQASDRTYARLAREFTESQILELLILPGFYRMIAAVPNSIRIDLDPGLSGWPTPGQSTDPPPV